jgi:hypothetical protein
VLFSEFVAVSKLIAVDIMDADGMLLSFDGVKAPATCIREFVSLVKKNINYNGLI